MRIMKSIFSLLMIMTLTIAFSACGEGNGTGEAYDWPEDNEIAQMLPTPEGEVTSIYVDDELGELNADITISDESYCGDYIEACKVKGFTINVDSSQFDNDYDFTAKNKEGWELEIYNFSKDMTISLVSPDYWGDSETETTTEATTQKETTSTTKAVKRKGRINEMAFRAAVVAMTNATAYDVFREDNGNAHDPSKYHSYSEQSGECTWEILSDGYWEEKGNNEWHVKSLKMVNQNDVEMDVSLDVKYDGNNYVISKISGEMYKPGTDLEPTDLAIATDPHYVENNTSLIVPKSLIDKDR